MSYPDLDLSKGILPAKPSYDGPIRRNPACPQKGDSVKSIDPTSKFFGKIGYVQAALVIGHSYMVYMPTSHGFAVQRCERQNLEVVDDKSAADKESVALSNIYRRYSRIRLITLIDMLHIVLTCANLGEVIHALTKEARRSAYLAFSAKDAEAFLQDNGLPSKDMK